MVKIIFKVVNSINLAYHSFVVKKVNSMENKLILKIVDSALQGNIRSAQIAIRKLASKVRATDKELFKELSSRLSNDYTRSIERTGTQIPVDSDSRLSLVRTENPVTLDKPPIYSDLVKNSLEQVLLERKNAEQLLSEGLYPSKSIIFQGPPGVGKTMSARWLADRLELPLLILDLATVISSFLGKTGSNIRAVLDHASSFPCVLLLDEFDAIAKRRDDDRELGELKRLVTVLLQSIDDWPETSLLIAATNHGELLDPAIWRRFDLEVTFDIPSKEMIKKYLDAYWPEVSELPSVLPNRFEGLSYSDIDRTLRTTKKESILTNISFQTCLLNESLTSTENLTMQEKKLLAANLHKTGASQREIVDQVGISRPTVKKVIDQLNGVEK